MKISIHPVFLLILAVFLNHNGFFSQSLSGNMKNESSVSLGYGNVDIFKGDKKVASVLTDAEGNYSVKLDTGLYRIEMQYAGFKKEVKEIRVVADERSDANLERDPDARVYKEKPEARNSIYADDYVFEEREVKVKVKKIESRADILPEMAVEVWERGGHAEGKSGVLTAGEINDFSKWEMWQDLVLDDLNRFRDFWKLQPNHRYAVQLTNENDRPVVDAEVHLLNDSGEILYVSRTDNTGKAELWGTLGVSNDAQGRVSAKVYFEDQEYEIERLSAFEQGVNIKKLNVSCNENTLVDIAFVVDATGSMSDEINFLKKELNDIIYTTKNSNPELTFNFASVFYRDHEDDYLTRTQNFSEILSESVSFIDNQFAGGGGDFEEAVEIALDSAVNSLNWSENARARILFLVLDAPPHNNPEIRTKLENLMRQASSRGIRIIPLVASGINKDAEYLMRTIALATNGTYAFLTDHSGIGGKHIEPSTDEYGVELLSDLLTRIISAYIFVPKCDVNLVDQSTPPDSILIRDQRTYDERIDWSFWPNPTRGEIQIKVDRDISEMYLTDLTGKILERYTDLKKDRILRRDLSQYPRGIYLLTFALGERVVTGKVVLQ
ncbi:MAG: T9SS type A sorting domain-containing protein [Brumimicrobium sp.]|nr:T9SS type A sorting domain-containing protein [Brumimicrobium sp.]